MATINQGTSYGHGKSLDGKEEIQREFERKSHLIKPPTIAKETKIPIIEKKPIEISLPTIQNPTIPRVLPIESWYYRTEASNEHWVSSGTEPYEPLGPWNKEINIPNKKQGVYDIKFGMNCFLAPYGTSITQPYFGTQLTIKTAFDEKIFTRFQNIYSKPEVTLGSEFFIPANAIVKMIKDEMIRIKVEALDASNCPGLGEFPLWTEHYLVVNYWYLHLHLIQEKFLD